MEKLGKQKGGGDMSLVIFLPPWEIAWWSHMSDSNSDTSLKLWYKAESCSSWHS